MNELANRVLLVDDEADQRTMTRLLLMGEGIETREADSGEAALALLEADLPDLVLLDFNMPGLDGVQTLSRIRERYNDRELPVLMLSARQETEIIVAALDNGANDYITKLTDPPVLLARVRRHLHRCTLRAQRACQSLGNATLGELLGEGGAASTYRLESEPELVAKILKPGFSLRPGAEKAPSIPLHPGLSGALTSLRNPVDHIITRYIPGKTLHAQLSEGPLSQSGAVQLLLDILAPLQELHGSGGTHRDLRPNNIKLPPDGPPVVLDVGVADLIVLENEVSASDFFFGHPAYQAPEQLRGSRKLEVTADLYSLGAILFCCLTGRAPFEGPISQIPFQVLEKTAPKVSEARADQEYRFDFVVHKLLAKEPDKRYQTLAELEQKLRELQEELD